MPRLAITLALAACLGMGTVRAQQITGDEVRLAIRAGSAYLLNCQRPDGTWPDFRFQGGTASLAGLALLNAGTPPDHPRMKAALQAISRIKNEHTYVVAIKVQALAAGNPRAYRAEIAAAANWLVDTQNADGLWGYGLPRTRSDLSNSQFALLGLHEAGLAGARIPQAVWRQTERAWLTAQRDDGGWGYTAESSQSTGSMTTAGIASLYITGNSLLTRRERGFTNGQATHCGRYGEYRPIARGLVWLNRNFSVARNPNEGGWYYYYLYGLERVGILSGLQQIGRHDWYREAAARLVRGQRADGSWQESNAVVDTAFALLFLAKGHRPILVYKLKWSDDNRWRPDAHDVAHLADYAGSQMEGGPFGWNVADIDTDAAILAGAPLLFFNGHEFPKFTAEQIATLQQYIENGGTILAEACCGQETFRTGFAAFAREVFPDYTPRRLPADHPVFRSQFELDGGKIELHGIDVGCRTSVFYSPVDLSCLWEQADVPELSEAAFKLGTNIAAYAVGRQPLPDRLDVVRLAAGPATQDADETPARGGLQIGQLMHNGDWRPDPNAMLKLADFLREQLGVDVVRGPEPLKPTDPRLARHPILYMTGHFSFTLTDEETAALRQHLERGGFLLAEACCGRKPFDTSFKEMVARLFPEHPLETLPADHPILAGSPGFPLTRVRYRPAVLAEQPGLDRPRAESITLEGRTVLVYSPYGIGCGIDGHACPACRGLEPDDARKLAANAVLYALSH